MGRKMSNEVILDFWNDIIILRIISICLAILLIFLTISSGFLYNHQSNSDDRLVRLNKMINGYMAKDNFMIASIQINKQMTVSDLERLYIQFGKQPSAQAILSQYVKQICEG